MMLRLVSQGTAAAWGAARQVLQDPAISCKCCAQLMACDTAASYCARGRIPCCLHGQHDRCAGGPSAVEAALEHTAPTVLCLLAQGLGGSWLCVQRATTRRPSDGPCREVASGSKALECRVNDHVMCQVSQPGLAATLFGSSARAHPCDAGKKGRREQRGCHATL